MTSLTREAVAAACTRPGVVRLHFQPIVDLTRGVVAGYEALARFHGPPDAPPDAWFAAAHDAGLGDRLEARCLALALDARAALPPNVFLTVNLSPPALVSRPVRALLARASDLRGLVIEVTEQAPVEDYALLLAALEPLRDAGALVAVDDAGAGFASLKHITTLRPAFVKIDRGLVSGVATDETKAALLETLGIFASRVDAWLVAEGIETESELERVMSLGVPLGQGYGLGRPTAGMAPLDREVARRCAAAGAAHGDELLTLVATIPAVTAAGGDAAVAEALLSTPDTEWVAVVDEFERPIWLVRRGARERVAVLAVSDDEAIADVARRAAVRAPADRFTPIAVCDGLGRLRGTVAVERLLWALGNAVAGEEAKPVRRSA